MKSLAMKILKVFLVLLLIALVLLLISGLVLMIGWPLWVGIFFIIGLAGLLLGLLFVKKLMARKSEQRFVQEVIAQDDSHIQGLSSGAQAGSRELQDRWKEAIDTLRKSHLKKVGNPLYVLPWYMVIGESGSGKTTAIKAADLSSPFAEVTRAAGISGTRNCDWWFFEQAVLIDTAGRYAIPVDESRDKDEWQKFLSLLAKFRKREPLNGLVVTVAADRLTRQRTADLETAGRSIRQRIDELMRVLGAKFPVYVMVTKCDLVQGAVTFCDGLEAPALEQAMGRVNQSLSADMGAFTDQTMLAMGDRLKELRLLMLNQVLDRKADSALMMFPEEFGKLSPGINAFMRGAFQENPYQETPIVRGIYFSSGRQEGTPYSHFLNAMGLIAEKDVLPGTNRGLFLHDFFARILPADRGLFAPTQKRLEWGRLTRSIGLTAWVAVVIALCGLLSFSFVKNLKTLRDVSGQFSTPPVLQGELTPDVLTLDRFRQAVSRIEMQNAKWWIPRLGLTESEHVEAGLKARYCEIFKSGFLADFDKRMAERMTRFTAATPPDRIGHHAMHLTRRINLLRHRMESGEFESLSALPAAAYASALLEVQTIDEISDKLSELYLYYLLWRADDRLLNSELKDLQTWLKHILTSSGARLNWLVDWVNINGDAPAVTLATFWNDLGPDENEIVVAPAFTVQGKAAVDDYIREIESALFEPLVIGSQKLDFQDAYREMYLDAWKDFVDYFPKGLARLPDRDRWKQAGMRMPTKKGPHLALLDTMAAELAAYKDVDGLPGWVDLVHRFKSVSLQAKAAGREGDPEPGILKKASQAVSSKLGRLEQATGVNVTDALNFEAQMEAGKAYNQYRDALTELVPIVDSRKAAFKVASTLYSEDPAEGESAFSKARRGQRRLRTVLGGATGDTERFWDLVNGPIRFYHTYVAREAQCQLQSIWEKEVYLEVQDIPQGTNLNQLLMGTDGFATRFLKGPAEPFIGRSRSKGYFARSVDGQALDLNPDFLTFLTRGASAAKPVAAEYRVTIKAYPTDANKSAVIKPHATSLELQCGDQRNRLMNLHYPVRKTFRWSPRECGDVIFKIEIGDLVLTKVYPGYQGFARFLQDFKTGKRTFRPGDFPEQAAALKRMGVKTITPRYQFRGHQKVLTVLQVSPGRVPEDIASCWGS
jgi:type VI secretion system protein ImpL